MAKQTETVELKPIELAATTIRVRGITSLIVHNWSEKARRQILEKQMGTQDKSKNTLFFM